MEHNRTKNKNDTVSIFAHSLNLGTFEMYKILNDTAVNITPNGTIVESIGNDTYKATVTLPNEDCIVCTVLNKQAMFLRVGNPDVRYCFYTGKTGYVIPYKMFNVEGATTSSGNLKEYGYGLYGFKPAILDYNIIECAGEQVVLDVPYIKEKPNSGTITLQRGVWQLIAIPREATVAEYLCDRLSTQEGVAAEELIEVVNTYRGSDNKFLSYVPGVTSKQSVNNFTLIYNDNGSNEIAGVWVKTKKWTHTTNDLVISWESN